MEQKRKPQAQWRGLWVTVGTFLLAVAMLLAASGLVANRADSEQAELLRKAVLRASLTCYAVEGRYPADAAHLEEFYGIRYNHDRYQVVVDGFAANVLPDIRVLVKGGQ